MYVSILVMEPESRRSAVKEYLQFTFAAFNVRRGHL